MINNKINDKCKKEHFNDSSGKIVRELYFQNLYKGKIDLSKGSVLAYYQRSLLSHIDY